MYPNLLAPLLILVAITAVVLIWIAVRRPVARRLAGRQLVRRRREAVLAATGTTLGTAIIIAALVVGDTLNSSIRQAAYQTLGPIDERIVSTTAATGAFVQQRVAALVSDKRIDGVLSARYVQAVTERRIGGRSVAEPRTVLWGMDFLPAEQFGRNGGPSGLTGPTPGRGRIVLNQPLADSLSAHPGDVIGLHAFGRVLRLTVARVLPERGLAGAGPGASLNRNAFVDPAIFPSRPAAADRAGVTAVTFVSNRGGVESGAALSGPVSATVRQALGPTGKRSLIETPKRDALDAARRTGDTLGAVFLMIGSFSIIAGALLLVNIFVMLGEERKEQLGMLRAIGMRRGTLIGSLTIEGTAYSVGALVPGVLVGMGVGWAVARLAAQIFGGQAATGNTLSIQFAVTPTSLLNGAALGLLIGVVTIFVTSVRISRLNVIAAIRDVVVAPRPRARRLLTAAATSAAVLLAATSVPVVANSQAESSYLLPSLAAFLAIPMLRRFLSARQAVTTTAAAVLVWCLALPLIRPRLFDHASMASFVIEGTLLAFAGVALVSQNQTVLLAPVRAIGRHSAERRLAARLAVAYPLAKRFRTGATLMMYTLITLVLVLLVEVSGVLDHSIGTKVAQATASYALRVEVNPAAGPRTVAALSGPEMRARVAAVAPLVEAPALAADPGHRTVQLLHALAVGVNPRDVSRMSFDSRLPSTPTDATVWNLIARNPRYVAMDPFFGSAGGPNGRYFAPGDSFTVVDPRSGMRERKTIAGILTNASVFYPGVGNAMAYPFVESIASVRAQFGAGAVTDAALIRAAAGVSPQRLAAQLQGRFLNEGLIAIPVGPAVRRTFDANIAFFRLMQGFLALGLLVGITGLGVVMVRAVRERRRTIGMLRALGVQARTVRAAFLLESAIIAVEGVALGSVLGVLTTWLMYRKSAMFDTVRSGFPILWTTLAVLLVVTLLASLAATVTPARRAAGIRPALAVRVAD